MILLSLTRQHIQSFKENTYITVVSDFPLICFFIETFEKCLLFIGYQLCFIYM